VTSIRAGGSSTLTVVVVAVIAAVIAGTVRLVDWPLPHGRPRRDRQSRGRRSSARGSAAFSHGRRRLCAHGGADSTRTAGRCGEVSMSRA
jgi:hypothetical protein